jgi:hypothetical protein
METLMLVLNLLRKAFPIPEDWSDQTDVEGWIDNISEPLAAIIADVADQFKKTSCAAIPEDLEVQITELSVEKFGDGRLLDLIRTWLPIIIKFLPLILEPEDETKPDVV